MSDKEWSKDLPSEDGYYWARSKNSAGEEKVYCLCIMAGWVHSILTFKPVSIKEYSGAEIEWYGPITAPE